MQYTMLGAMQLTMTAMPFNILAVLAPYNIFQLPSHYKIQRPATKSYIDPVVDSFPHPAAPTNTPGWFHAGALLPSISVASLLPASSW